MWKHCHTPAKQGKSNNDQTAMTPQQTKEFLPLLQAYASGEVIQYHDGDDLWRDLPSPSWTGPFDHYRIKPKPETRIMTLADLPDGTIWVRGNDSGIIETVNRINGKRLETLLWRGEIADFVADHSWSTSHKGPWKPFTVEVEASA